MNFIAVIVFALANGVTPTSQWLEMIPIVLGFMVLATGIGMLLSALYVRFRDVQPIWDVFLQVLFYALADHVPRRPRTRPEALASHGADRDDQPASRTLLAQMGHAFVDPSALPDARSAQRRRCAPVLIAIAIILGVFALGWWVFTREAPRVAENL